MKHAFWLAIAGGAAALTLAAGVAQAQPQPVQMNLLQTLAQEATSPIEEVRHRRWHRHHCHWVKRCWWNHWGIRRCRWVRRCW